MLATFAKKRKFMMTREEILSIEEYYAEHKVSYKKRQEDWIYHSGTSTRRRKSIEKRMNKKASLASSSSYHLADMSLRQCLRLVLPVDPANSASRLRKRTRAISSAETMMPLSEQPSSIHSSAVARHMTSMFAHGLKTFSKEFQQKKTSTNYYLVTGRYYPLIAGNSCYYQLLAAITGVVPGNGG